MKMGTKLFLGTLVAMALLVGLVLLVGEEKHSCPDHSKSHLPSLISDAQASPSPTRKHSAEVFCYPDGDPPVTPTKLDEPGDFYTITFTQGFTISNGSNDWRKFTLMCAIMRGPSKDSEKPGVTELIVKPRELVGYPEVKIVWPRAFKSVEQKEFHYLCTCAHKVVERPLKTFKIPFVPSE